MTMKSMNRRYLDECQRRKLPVDLSPSDLEMQLTASMEGLPTQIGHMALEDKAENLKWLRRFQSVYHRVQGEHRALVNLCIESLRHGYEVVLVDDGEERQKISHETPLSEITELAMAVDKSAIIVRGRQTGDRLHFFLIFGNSPEELIADHTDHPDAQLIWDAVQARG